MHSVGPFTLYLWGELIPAGTSGGTIFLIFFYYVDTKNVPVALTFSLANLGFSSASQPFYIFIRDIESSGYLVVT